MLNDYVDLTVRRHHWRQQYGSHSHNLAQSSHAVATTTLLVQN